MNPIPDLPDGGSTDTERRLAGRIEAMRLAGIGSIVALEGAVAHDPGSYRIRMRTADAYFARGQCAKARPHAEVARGLFPSAPAPKRLLEQCR